MLSVGGCLGLGGVEQTLLRSKSGKSLFLLRLARGSLQLTVFRGCDRPTASAPLWAFFLKEAHVLIIYPVVLEFIGSLWPLLAQIERRDRDLGRQLRRASSSVALNLAESVYSRGELRTARYHTALGSMRESQSCLEVAKAFGYVRELDCSFMAAVNRIIGTLVRLVEGKR